MFTTKLIESNLGVPCQIAGCHNRVAYNLCKEDIEYGGILLCRECTMDMLTNLPKELATVVREQYCSCYQEAAEELDSSGNTVDTLAGEGEVAPVGEVATPEEIAENQELAEGATAEDAGWEEDIPGQEEEPEDETVEEVEPEVEQDDPHEGLEKKDIAAMLEEYGIVISNLKKVTRKELITQLEEAKKGEQE